MNKIAARAVALFFLFGVWAGAGSAMAERDGFAEANAAYEKGDFKTAADLYEELLRTHPPTAAARYNLGNAYFRLGEKGKALLNYERALAACPRDGDLAWNIRVLKSVLPDRLEGSNASGAGALAREALGFFSLNETCLLLGVFLFSAAAAALFWFLFPRFKIIFKSLRTLFLALAFLTALVAAAKWRDTKDPLAVVLVKEIDARYGPSQKETKAFLLHEGAEARVLDESGDWFYVSLANKNAGWIPKSSCEAV
ncbi:MAG: tetratricopeptide repeat protein [Candidatus Omnitrophica bacterium]|nr:tetratricopeptide repeat protein [Candidatus Omnitrophota bacterium]